MFHKLYRLWLKGLSLLSMLLFPLLYEQAAETRKQVLHLPIPQGAMQANLAGHYPACQLLALGEWTVLGLGAETQQQGLTAQVAQYLNQHTQQAMHWQALGCNGIDLHKMQHWLSPQVEPIKPDFLLISLGINDSMQGTSCAQWHEGLHSFIAEVRPYVRQGIFFTAVPPLQHLRGAPQPLRSVLGLRAAAFNEELQQLLHTQKNCWYIPFPSQSFQAQHLDAAGYHFSAEGYAWWGAHVAQFVLRQQTLALKAQPTTQPFIPHQQSIIG